MSKFLTLIRLVAAIPLLLIGIQHVTGAAPMLPILTGAGLPEPELTAQLAPFLEVAGGALLLLGLFARFGALLAVGSMVGALAAHLRFDHTQFEWPDEPPIALPIAILVCALIVLAMGPGAFALQGKKGNPE